MQTELCLDALVKELSYAYYRHHKDKLAEIYVKDIKAVALDLEDVALAVYQEPSAELELSVLQEMKYPIIVCPNTPEEYKMAIKGLTNLVPYDKTKKYLTIIGNQRQTIAIKNGFESIDAFIVETGLEALVVKKVYDDESAIR